MKRPRPITDSAGHPLTYRVVDAPILEGLEAAVNQATEAGYAPEGGIAYALDKMGHEHYMQALTLDGKGKGRRG